MCKTCIFKHSGFNRFPCIPCNPYVDKDSAYYEGTDKWEGISYTYKITHNLKGEHKNG